MELREIWVWPMGFYTDEILKLSYLRVLTKDHIESIKLPTSVSNYRHNHQLNPRYLLKIELIKTRKNWILKSIIEHIELLKPDNYQGLLKLGEMTQILLKHTHTDQEVHILDFIEDTISKGDISTLNLAEFEKKLEGKLGF
jgi:hypothetical protein